jgi:hypothetical protein
METVSTIMDLHTVFKLLVVIAGVILRGSKRAKEV